MNRQTGRAARLAAASLGIAFLGISVSHGARALELVRLGQPLDNVNGWLVSDWGAGQAARVVWDPDNVRLAEDGALEFVLYGPKAAAAGAEGIATEAADAGDRGAPGEASGGADGPGTDGGDAPGEATAAGAEAPNEAPNEAPAEDANEAAQAAERAAAQRTIRGAEVQSVAVAETGGWRWHAQAPRMVDGAVFGMFLYRASHEKDPWREYDFEFVGEDTTEVQLNIHFEDEEGRHVALSDAKGGPVIVDLGFDAAEAAHLYEIEVGEDEAIFRVDGEVVGRFGPADMPGGTWSVGPLRSMVDLWVADPAAEGWTGRWEDPGVPLVARVERLELPVTATVPK